MKRFFIKYVLNVLCRFVIRRYRPIVVGITGSVGKTSAKDAVALVLGTKFSTRKSERNLNSDIGVPLVFIGGVEAKRSVLQWIANIVKGLRLLVVHDASYPRCIVAEMGADRPGDIKYLTGLAQPHIGVVTAIGEVPVHVAYYRDIESAVREKSQMVRGLRKDGWAVLNADDGRVLQMREGTRAKIITFGFNESADVRISDYQIRLTERDGRRIPEGVSFRINYGGAMVPLELPGVIGKPSVYAAAVGAAVGIAAGMHLVDIAHALSTLQPEPGRMRMLEGMNESVILDDSYNAAPAAMHAALDTLAEIPAQRKIAVLGDMLELGSFSESAHRAIGERLVSLVQEIVLVGPYMRNAADVLKAKGFPQGHWRHFDASADAIEFVRSLAQKGDVILVKGSQGMRMELIVEKIMAHSEIARNLLVRQSEEWRK